MSGISVRNIIHGAVVTDPKELAARLELDQVGNLMINVDHVFTEEEKKADHAGTQLLAVMLSCRMQLLDKHSLLDLMERIAFKDGCDCSPIPLPQGASSLVPVYQRLKTWVAKGWELEIGSAGMNAKDFYAFERFKMLEAVGDDITQVVTGASDAVKEAFSGAGL